MARAGPSPTLQVVGTSPISAAVPQGDFLFETCDSWWNNTSGVGAPVPVLTILAYFSKLLLL